MIDSLIAIISGMTGFITGILGVIFSLYKTKRDKYDSVNEFLTQIESEYFISSRNYVYNHNDKYYGEYFEWLYFKLKFKRISKR